MITKEIERKRNVKISILMLTYNAPMYVKHSINSIRKHTQTESICYELIVWDNNSTNRTKQMLRKLKTRGAIDKLILSDKNYLFVGGNNRAAEYSDPDSELLLLLNSDIEIKNTAWLQEMVHVHKRGITATQVCSEKDKRPDGWCLLIDKDIFMKFKLDEERFTWFFSIADLGSKMMKSGYSIQTIRYYEDFIHHFGGASEVPENIKVSSDRGGIFNVEEWYPQPCNVIEKLDLRKGQSVHESKPFIIYHLYCRMKRKLKKL